MASDQAEEPDGYWTVWYRDSDCRTPCLVRSIEGFEVCDSDCDILIISDCPTYSLPFTYVVCDQSFKEYETTMGMLYHLWSLPMGSQIRILKTGVDAHGRPQISNKWVSFCASNPYDLVGHPTHIPDPFTHLKP